MKSDDRRAESEAFIPNRRVACAQRIHDGTQKPGNPGESLRDT